MRLVSSGKTITNFDQAIGQEWAMRLEGYIWPMNLSLLKNKQKKTSETASNHS